MNLWIQRKMNRLKKQRKKHNKRRFIPPFYLYNFPHLIYNLFIEICIILIYNVMCVKFLRGEIEYGYPGLRFRRYS